MSQVLEQKSTAVAPATHLAYNPAIDGLRACAVAAVVLSHAGLTGLRGYHGVTVFFVLSGYLITSLLMREYSRTGRINLPRFWLRRLARLGPAMVLIVAVTTLWLLLTQVPLEKYWLGIVGTLTYTMDIVQALWGNDHVSSHFQWSWSLGIEEQFYLLWPLLVILAMRGRGRRRLYLTVALGYVITSALRLGLELSDPTHEARYFGPFSHLDALILGAGIAVIAAHLGTATWLRRLSFVLGPIGVVGLLWSICAAQGIPAFRSIDPAGFGLSALSAGFIVLWVVMAPRSLFARVVGMPPLAFLGKLSYGIYLWNLLTVHVFERIFHVPPVESWWGIAWLAALIGICYVSWRWVETPLRKRWAPR